MTADLTPNSAGDPQAQPPVDNVELHLPSILGFEKIARRAVEAVAEQMDFDPARIEDLKTAVAEACMNAIEHGNHLERAIQVTVQMLISPDRLEVRVADIGRQPVPDALPSPGDGARRGWGMYFIQQLVDELEVVRLPDGGNQVSMALYLVRQEGDPATSPAPVGPVAPRALQRSGPPPQALLPAEDRPKALQPADVKPLHLQPAADPPRALQSVTPLPTALQPADALPSWAAPGSESAAKGTSSEN